MKSKRNLAWGIVSSVSLIAPLVIVASCSSNQDNNLKITPITNPAIVSLDLEGNSFKSISTLKKVFRGIDQDKLNKLDVTLQGEIAEGSSHTITLVVKDGFNIDGKEEIKSNEFKLHKGVMPTGPKNDEEIVISDKSIAGEGFKSLPVLQKLFNGIELLDFDNMDITISGQNVQSEQTITLTAHEGYTFVIDGVGTTEVTSNEFKIVPATIDIKAKLNPVVRNSDLEGNKFKELPTLQRVFEGIDQAKINNYVDISLQGEIGSETTHTITLTARDGFDINGEKTLVSSEFQLLLVISNVELANRPNNDIHIVRSDIENDNYKSLASLQKIFGNMNQEKFDKLEATLQGEIGSGTLHTVTLTSKRGFTINGEGSLVSTSFNLPVTLPITNKSSIININHLDIRDNNFKSLATLQKIFNGIDSDNLLNMDATLQNNIASGSSHTITLTAKNGFTINGEKTLVSNQFTLPIIPNFVISKKTNEEIIQVLKGDITTENLSKLATLGKLFTGLQQEWLTNIDVSLQEVTTIAPIQYTVTLTAKEGFTINGEKNLVSNPFTLPTILPISKKVITSTIIDIELQNDGFKSLKFLEKLFSEIKEFHIPSMTITMNSEIINSVTSHSITLSVGDKFNFVENDVETKSITSNKFETTEPIDLSISRITSPTPVITSADIEGKNFEKIETLNKLFTGINTDNFDNIAASLFEISPNSYMITLLADAGYTINGSQFLDSITFTITARSSFESTLLLSIITNRFNIK